MRFMRLLILLVLGASAGYFLLGRKSAHQTPREMSSYGQVGEFTLIDQHGHPFGAEQLKNKVWIANFIFTRCQGPCPLLTANMAALQKKLSELSDVRHVSITIDPEWDKPEVLAAYAQKNEAQPERWHFLTGEKPAIISLATKEFKLAADDDPNLHTTTFVVVDQNMMIRGYFDGKDEEALKGLIETVEALVKQPS